MPAPQVLVAMSWPQAPATVLAGTPGDQLSYVRTQRVGGEMAGGISVHAVDVATGRPADGLRVEIWRLEPARSRIAEGRLGPKGQLDHPVTRGVGVESGEYEVLFHLGEFFADDD